LPVHQGTDLVTLPTEGRGPLRRFLLGSVTAKVLQDTGAAVWTGSRSSTTKKPRDVSYRSIICAVDDSNETEAVLRVAQAFVVKYEASLWLLHVVPPPHRIAGELLVDAMREEAAQLRADLIVMGHGHTQRMLGGVWSRSYSLVREARGGPPSFSAGTKIVRSYRIRIQPA